MKKLITMTIMVLTVAVAMAQVPEKFTYQAVVRNASNALVSNTLIGVRVSILQGSVTGGGVYVETQMPSTNANGLVTLNIGDGNVVFGTFSNIDWSDGPYFLKMEIDPTGGNDYSVTSTQQLLSVPYALYAKEAGNGFSGDYNDLVNRPLIPQVPADVSAFNNDAGYITMDSVPAIPANVSAFINDAGYITMDSVPAIPANVSAFTNDAGYLTNYAETDPTVPAWAKEANKPAYDYSEIVNTPTIPTVPADVSAFINDAGYITMDSVPAIPANVSAFNNDAGYITMDSVPAIPANVSAFTNDAGYITSIIEEQMLTISNDTIFLTGGSFVKLPVAAAGFSGDYNDLTHKPVLFDGDYNSLDNKPVLFDGDYYSLTNTPTIPMVPANVSAFTNDAGYITMDSVPAIPANVSAFTNDAGYLTNYAETDPTVPAWAKEAYKPAYDYSEIVNTPTIPTVPANVSAFTNDAGYITMDSVPTIPANVSAFINDAGYITKDSIPDNVSAFANDAEYITIAAVPTQVSAFQNDALYITEGELQQTVNVINNTFDSVNNVMNNTFDSLGNVMNDMDNTIDSLRSRIEELEGTHTPPTVMTTGAADVAFRAAVVNGSIVHVGASPVTARGFCYDTVMHPTVDGNVVNCGSGSGDFSTNLLNLAPNTTYFVRAYATNIWGTNYGNELTFTTLEEIIPTVDMLPVPDSSISYTSIACGGVVTDTGSYAVTARGICYGTEQEVDITGSHVFLGSGVGEFSTTLTDLVPATTYYLRAYAQNQAGIAYSTPVALTTQAASAPTVITNSVSMFSECVGTVTSDGHSPVTARGFCYDTLPNPTIGNNVVMAGAGLGEFSATISGMPNGKICFVRAFATNSEGTSYGSQIDFVFLAGCDVPTLTDYDGNTYNTVAIGTQCWMKENLRTTHYSDGWPIAHGSESSTDVKYYYYPGNNPVNVETYGLLYNWAAVMNGAVSSDAVPSGVQGICPSGWHVPSLSEWNQLFDYVRSQSEYLCNSGSSYSTEYIAKALADSIVSGASSSSSYPCSVLSNSSDNNATGFSWRRAGSFRNGSYHINNGTGYGDFYLWSTTENYQGAAMAQVVQISIPGYSEITTNAWTTHSGLSVRCVRDSRLDDGNETATSTVTTSEASNITETTATCGGNVTSDGGVEVTARGICWSTLQTPTISDSHTEDGSGTGSFTSQITGLTAGTTYYVRAYATNSTGTAYGNLTSFTTAFTCGTSTVTDVDSNVYNTVQIGDQCWMKENLRTTRYSDGTAIPLSAVTSSTVAYRYNTSDISTYGYLYNWKAVMRNSGTSSANPSGVQGVCPLGWHVPSDAEWTQLADYVSSQSEYVCGENSSYIAKALASDTLWSPNNGSCCVGNDLSTNNATGFSALPTGSGVNQGSSTGFWCCTRGNSISYAWAWRLSTNNRTFDRNGTEYPQNGCSVRCLRD